MREDHSEIKNRENEKIPTRVRETVRFLEISMEHTFILDFSPYGSHIMYVYTQLHLVSTFLKILGTRPCQKRVTQTVF